MTGFVLYVVNELGMAFFIESVIAFSDNSITEFTI